MLNEEAIRIKLERLEVLLDEQFKLIEKSFSDGTNTYAIIDMQMDGSKIHGKIEVLKEVLEEK